MNRYYVTIKNREERVLDCIGLRELQNLIRYSVDQGDKIVSIELHRNGKMVKSLEVPKYIRTSLRR